MKKNKKQPLDSNLVTSGDDGSVGDDRAMAAVAFDSVWSRNCRQWRLRAGASTEKRRAGWRRLFGQESFDIGVWTKNDIGVWTKNGIGVGRKNDVCVWRKNDIVVRRKNGVGARGKTASR
ncbi:hypothetical protein LINPERPRIM_LOCUS1018 [Linum perenne]